MPEHITIGDVSPRIQHTGNGSETQFAYPFPIFVDGDLEVHLDDALQSSGFTVAGAGASSGGTVTFDAAPSNGVKVTLRRRLSIARSGDFQEEGEFRSKVINDELDFLTACVQQVADDVGRGVLLHATDAAASMTLPDVDARSGRILGCDADGGVGAVDGVPGPQGPTGPGGADGAFDGTEATVTPQSADAFAFYDVSDADAPKLATLASVRDALAGTSADDLVQLDGSAKLPAADGSQLTGITIFDPVANANIALNAFRIAVNGGLSVQNMVDGVVDAFEDETGVDTSASTDETYDATGDYYHNPGGYSSDILTGGTVSNTGGTGGGSIGNTVDGNTGTSFYWSGDNSAGGVYWKYDLGSGNSAKPAKLRQYVSATAGNLGGWRLEGSNDDSSWSLIASSATDGAFSDSTGWQEKTFTAPGAAYRYLRIEPQTPKLAVYGNGPLIYELEMMENLSPDDMTLQSNATTAEAEPDDVFIVVWEEDVDSVTLNTDLKAWASRDGGTTWTQITLAEEADLATGRILTGSADISGQPSGTSMKWKVTTHNNTELRLHGAALEWS